MSHSTSTVFTPSIVNTLRPAGQFIVRLHLIARIFWLPLSAGISVTSSAIMLPTEIPFTAVICGELIVVELVVVELVVVWRILIQKFCKIEAGVVLTNDSILRLTGVPVVPTIAPDTRTGSVARVTIAVAEQSVPEHETSPISPRPTDVHWNTLLSVGPMFPAGVTYCTGPRKRSISFALFAVRHIYTPPTDVWY
jgi:hypothetical protein